MILQALRHVPLLMMLIGLSGLPAAGQTLGDLAKQPGTPAPKGPARSFSDKDLKASSGGDGAVATASGDAADVARPGVILSREEIVRLVMPAVVTIQAGGATGSGFFIGP